MDGSGFFGLDIMLSKTVILASASPGRKELLEKIGLEFEVESSDHGEEIVPGVEPHELARRLSLEKARIVAARHQNAVVIAADTFGVFRGRIIGKPRTEKEARQMLALLSGRSHLVITGFTIIDTDSNKTLSRTVETRVHFKKLSPEEIEAYVSTGEPLDKAGAYAIQGMGAVIVDRIEGDYYNVIGLPLSAVAESLKEFGVKVL